MDKQRLRKLSGILIEEEILEATGNVDAVTNDLLDIFKLVKGKTNIKREVLKVIRDLDSRERAAVAIFVANLADELDPDVPTPENENLDESATPVLLSVGIKEIAEELRKDSKLVQKIMLELIQDSKTRKKLNTTMETLEEISRLIAFAKKNSGG